MDEPTTSTDLPNAEARVDAAARVLAGLLLDKTPADHDRIAIVAHRAPAGTSSSYRMSIDLHGHWFDDVAPLLEAIQGLAGQPPSTTFAELIAHRDGAWELAACWEDGLDDDSGGLTRTLNPDARPATPTGFPTGWAPTAHGPSAPEPGHRVPVATAEPGQGLGARLRRWFGGPSPAGSVGHLPSPSPGPSPIPPGAADRSGGVDLQALRRHVHAALPAYRVVHPQATAEQVAALESLVGASVPDELRALYGLADGAELDLDADDADDDHGRGIHGWYGWLSIEMIMKTYAWTRQHTWLGWSLGWDEARLETNPYGHVQRLSGHPGWVPVLDDGGGNWIGFDLAPAPGGRVGQVIEFGRDFDTATYLAPSLTALFQGWHTPQPRSSIMLRPEGLAAYAPGRPLTEALAALVEAEPALQELRLFGLPPVDLAPLARLGRLRVLALDCTDADLTSLRGLPLESIALRGADHDLGPLTGYPRLGRVTLRGTSNADLSVLATLPELTGIDLSASPALDPRLLGQAWEHLTYAHLHLDQWRTMIDSGTPMPRLAALTIAGSETFAEALALAAELDRTSSSLTTNTLTRSSGHG